MRHGKAGGSIIPRLMACVAMLAFAAWSVGHLVTARHAPPPRIDFCPAYGYYPPVKLWSGHHMVAIAFGINGTLYGVDRQGTAWASALRENTCQQTPPVHVDLTASPAARGEHDAALATLGASDYAMMAITREGRAVSLYFADYVCDATRYSCANVEDLGLDRVTAIANGLALRDDGTAWGRGDSGCGQSGVKPGPAFKRIGALSRIAAVASGVSNSMALDAGGGVWTWGNLSNPEFALRRSYAPGCRNQSFDMFGYAMSLQENSIPARVPGLPPVKAISTYRNVDLALTRDGEVWGWGYNLCGILGVDHDLSSQHLFYLERPVKIGGLPRIEAIAAGWRHALALDGNGAVWAWGSDQEMELGGRLTRSGRGRMCDGREEYAPSHSSYTSVPLVVPGIPRMVAIAAGQSASAAIDEQGDVWAWGLH